VQIRAVSCNRLHNIRLCALLSMLGASLEKLPREDVSIGKRLHKSPVQAYQNADGGES
jgi:hypothetical protein